MQQKQHLPAAAKAAAVVVADVSFHQKIKNVTPNMIKEILQKKYGLYITEQLMSLNNEVLIDKIDKSSDRGQSAVIEILAKLKELDLDKKLPEKFWNTEIEWGVDFSSWIGEFKNNKDYLFIGAEPHLKTNYQLVYGFGSSRNKDLKTASLDYYNDKNDIWHYVINNFSSDLSDTGKETFLKKCYITDLCYIVPKYCGKIDVICKTLQISRPNWNYFRTMIASEFLVDEIKSVNPKLIILHGASSRDFFIDNLKVKFEERFQIADWNRYILSGEYLGYKIVAIPHLKGQMLNELWRSKKHPERPKSAKEIITKILENVNKEKS